MALRINTNVAALNAHKNMIKNDNSLAGSLDKLSSGLRINKAADDASGMAIADSLKSQALGLGQAIRNANDGISMVQTADGALEESINIVNTIKTKAIQAAQDGQTTDSRKAIQADINKLMEELDAIAKTTSFNGQKLLSGQFTDKKFQIGAFSGETVGISIGSTEAGKVGHLTTGLLKTNSTVGGEVRLSIYSNTQNADIAIQSVSLAYDNTAENGMGSLAAAINKVADLTGVTAQANVSSTSVAAVASGSTGTDFAINGVTIGALSVQGNDADGSLANAINQKSSLHGVTASVDEGGKLTLTSSDGRAIQVTGDTGTTLMGSNLNTFGEIKLFQTGANEIKINDSADMVSLNLTANMNYDGAVTTVIDSTLAKNSVIASGSVIKAGSTVGFTMNENTFDLNITTTEDSTLVAGSVLGSNTEIKAGSIVTGDLTQRGAETTTADSLLKTGSVLTSGTVLAAGTVITTQFVADGNTYTAGTTLASDVTVSANVTLLADMTAKSGSVLDESNTYKAGSSFGVDMTISGTVTLQTAMTLKAGSVIGESNSSILAGSVIGGDVTVSTGEVTVTSDMTLKAGSVLAESDADHGILAKGSTLGGRFTLSSTALTVAGDMTIAAGSVLDHGSVLKAGTVLTDDIWVAGGNLLKAGTVLTGDAITSGSNYLDAAMTLKANSVLASGTVLAPTATSSSGATATTSISDVKKYKLSDVDVTTQEGAQVAISIADSALKTLDKVRSDLGSVQNQLTSTISNLSVTRVNVTAAESSIRDVDFAEESANFSRMQILSQAGTFAMSQANASAQNVLSLLQG
jgi:flagellin